MRVYLGLVAVLLLIALIAVIGWDYAPHRQRDRVQQISGIAGEIAQRLLDGNSDDADALAKELAHWHKRAAIDLTLFGRDGQIIASAGHRAPNINQLNSSDGFRGSVGRGLLVPLPDGRQLFLRFGTRNSRGGFMPGWFGFLMTLALATVLVSLVAYPVARRISARIERLEKGVKALGAGDLTARVQVEGNDEVASLAASFNDSAQRVEQLLGAQRSLLANASHELRSPLTRIRMALELLPKDSSVELREELGKDIRELDQLIEEILLASRLQADGQPHNDAFEPVDLAALCAEECARAGAGFAFERAGSGKTLSATPGLDATDMGDAVLRADAKLLRRLVRNLLENAQRYGEGLPVEVVLEAQQSEALTHATRDTSARLRLTVADRGMGVPPEDRARIFEPFYRSQNASEKQGGVGLGLSIAQQIAARHQTQIVCEARDGGGSVFSVEFAV